MSSCIALKISVWLILTQDTSVGWKLVVFFFVFQNVIKIILTISVGKGKINSSVVSYTTLKQQSGFPIKVWKFKMNAYFMSWDQLVGLAKMHNRWSRGKTSVLQLLPNSSAFLLLDFTLDITMLAVFSSYKNLLGFVSLQQFRIQWTTDIIFKKPKQ